MLYVDLRAGVEQFPALKQHMLLAVKAEKTVPIGESGAEQDNEIRFECVSFKTW